MAKCPRCNEAFEGVDFCPSDGARLLETESEVSPLVGEVLDKRYRVIRKIGDGASAEVFYAEHIHLKKQVAIKLLRSELAGRSEAIERFQREAQVASGIGHPNIVKVEDFCVLEDGSFYLAMEWLHGETLGSRLSRAPISIDDTIEIAKQVCSGLQAAHSVSIIHRDLKPANIFLQEGPRGKLGLPIVKLLDFGIAKLTVASPKLTRAGVFLGTPYYVSPEQAQAHPIDHRADVYSLGVILYEMVTGTVPFDAESALAVLQLHVQQAPEPPRKRAPGRAITPELEQIILRCMHKTPEKRYKKASDVEAALAELASLPSSTLPGIGLKLSDIGLDGGIPARDRRGAETDAETIFRRPSTSTDTQPVVRAKITGEVSPAGGVGPIDEDLRQTSEQLPIISAQPEDVDLQETGKHHKRALAFEKLDDADSAMNEFAQLTKTTRMMRSVRKEDDTEPSPLPRRSSIVRAERKEPTPARSIQLQSVPPPPPRTIPWLIIAAIILGVLGAGAAAYRFLGSDDGKSSRAPAAEQTLGAARLGPASVEPDRTQTGGEPLR